MKINKYIFISLLAAFFLLGCNPYKGSIGVDKKGMKKNKLPSQELRQDYDKMNRRARKAYKKEQKKRKKRLGTKEDSTPG